VNRTVLPRVASLFSWMTIGTVAIVAVVAACSNMGEGERCEALNGNDDCNSGLVCYPAAQLSNNSPSDRCCPVDRSQARAPVCLTAVDIVPDGGAPADTGPPSNTDASDAETADSGAAEETGAPDAGEDADGGS